MNRAIRNRTIRNRANRATKNREIGNTAISNRTIINNILWGAIIAFLTLIPDLIFSIISNKVRTFFHASFCLPLTAFFIVLSVSKNRLFTYFIILLFFVFDLAQFHHVFYFGIPIQPESIDKVFLEFDDIFQSIFAYMREYWFVFPILLLIYSTAFWVSGKFKKRFQSSLVFYILMFFCLSSSFYFCTKRIRFTNLYPNPAKHSLQNSFLGLFYYAYGKIGAVHFNNPKYKPYKLNKKSEDAENIVFIMGESTSPSHMSLFEYKRDTTPFLSSLKSYKNFYASKAISASVNTYNSLAIFFNMMREPKNLKLIQTHEFNLFKLAKLHGYKTFCISAQNSKNLSFIGIPFIDEIVTLDNNRQDFNKKHDFKLIELFESLKLSKKNFILIHMRCAHSPYHEYYKNKPEFKKYKTKNATLAQKRVDEYDNAMSFLDKVLEGIINLFNKRFQNSNSVLFYMSDHSELFGEDGITGHGVLNSKCAIVPFFMYSNFDINNNIQKILQKNSIITYYDVSKYIANLIGFEIFNENEKDQIGYIHGNSLSHNYNYIPYKRTKDELTFEKIKLLDCNLS